MSTFARPETPTPFSASALNSPMLDMSRQLFPEGTAGLGALPQLQANGRIVLPNGAPNGLAVEEYIPLLHLYTSILEADRIIHPFRKSLSLKPKTLANGQVAQAITPLNESRLHPNLFFKREDQTIVKAYKMRGAFCGMKRAMSHNGQRHFMAVSTGNHAMGVLKAAELLRPETVKIVVPNNTSEIKLKNINSKILAVRHRGVHAEVLYIGDAFDEARDWAVSQSLGGDSYYLDPFSNPWVVAGQGTIGLEVLRQLGPIVAQRPDIQEIVFISPIGGGGLLAGSATAMAMGMAWDDRFRGIALSFVGLRLQNMFTKYGDAVRVKHPAAGNLAVFEALHIQQLKMSDEMMAWGMQYMLEDVGDRVEGPSGAPAFIALNRPEFAPSAQRLVVALVSGGNVGAFPTE
jgi:threonine dehydratase